jgi:hypothetical protein
MEKIRILDGKSRIRDKHPGSAALQYITLTRMVLPYLENLVVDLDPKLYPAPDLTFQTETKL